MLPDIMKRFIARLSIESQCTYRCVVLPDLSPTSLTTPSLLGLNAPTGAWCSLTGYGAAYMAGILASQCTYRCVVLPDFSLGGSLGASAPVSMHLQVRGAP